MADRLDHGVAVDRPVEPQIVLLWFEADLRPFMASGAPEDRRLKALRGCHDPHHEVGGLEQTLSAGC